MMRAVKKQMWFALPAIALIMLVTPASHAQLNSGASTVALNANLGESLTLSVSAASVNFTLVPSGTANGSTPVGITTTWVLSTARTSLNVYAYFSSGTALTDGTNNIPTSSFNGSINGGAYSAFTGGSGPFGTNSKIIYTSALGAGSLNSSHVDSLGLQIDTTGLNLPSSTYTGTLNVQAQVI
jgi:hypothetical protein